MIYRFLYIEDEQMYCKNLVLMESEEPVDIEKLEKLSWSNPGAGRFSTSAHEMTQMDKNLSIVERTNRVVFPDDIPDIWKEYPIVKGATGNY